MKPTSSTTSSKLGPGEYQPDIAFTRIEDMPKPKIIKESRNEAHRPCPHCQKPAPRDRVFTRPLHDVGDWVSERPRELRIIYSPHYCKACGKYFGTDLTDVALRGSHYTYRVIALALRLVVEDGVPYRNARWQLWRDHRVFVPFATIQNWVEAGGKKASERWESDYLNWALADCSGYLAADELHDGPFCVLSLVDNRTFKRLFFQVLEHDPTPDDILAFFQRFQLALHARHLTVQGITTNGSPLYPPAIQAVWGSNTVNLRVSRGTPRCDTVCLPNKICFTCQGVPDEKFTPTSPTDATVCDHWSESHPTPARQFGVAVSNPCV